VIAIDESGASARAFTDFAYMRKTDDGFTISTAGRYYDRLVRESDRWRFQTRVIVSLGDPVPPDA
jgi:SnoaL-like domain